MYIRRKYAFLKNLVSKFYRNFTLKYDKFGSNFVSIKQNLSNSSFAKIADLRPVACVRTLHYTRPIQRAIMHHGGSVVHRPDSL